MENEFRFTVFTPTFNRKHTINRVYESLKSQSFSDFEWLVIDDGSTDQTGDLITEWQKKEYFQIRYSYQENQGKHIAFNRAVGLAKGKLFLPWDSDDAAVPETLERFWFHWSSIPLEQRNKFTGVTCLCQDENGNIVGDRFPLDIMDSDELEMVHKYKVRGEKWGFHRTELLKFFPFPDIPRIGYLPESVVWNEIALNYKKRFINEPLRIYFSLNREADQLMSLIRKNPGQHAYGRSLYHKENLNKCINWVFRDPLDFLKSAINYTRFSLHRGVNLTMQWNGLLNWKARLLWILTLPAGWTYYQRDKGVRSR